MKESISALAASMLAIAQLGQAQQPTEPVKAPTSWADKVQFKGDVRLRYESIDAEGKDVRERTRMRARVGAFAKPGSDMDVGVQFSTTEKNDPVSGNQTLGDGGSRKSTYFDLGYFDYHPENVPGLDLIGGKMEQPFIKMSDLVWDNDYNPEGVAVKYKTGDAVTYLFNAGGFQLQEREVGNETMMYGAQAAVKISDDQASYLQAGVSFFSYENIKGMAPLFDATKAKGNSTEKVVDGNTTNLIYANGFTTPEFFAEYVYNGGVRPVAVYGSYIVNTDADSEDTGYIGGIRYGKAKDPGTWELDYNWRHLEANAVVGALADSDSFGGGTDGEGHRFSASYQISKTLKSTLTYFLNETKIASSGDSYDRLQVDFSAKF